MLISITAINYSLTGELLFDAAEDSDLETTTRRVGRTPTLDGGCLITDGGFSDSDRTFRVKSKSPLTDSQIATLRTFHQSHALVNVALPGGVYKGVIQQFSNANNAVSLNILCKEKISA